MKNLIETNGPFFQTLKEEVEGIFGKRIVSSRDCIFLSDDVYSKISFKVNSNTLRRFFGLVKSNYLPSSTTLDILSKYCGFANFDEFKKLNKKIDNISNENYYSDSILNYLVSLFKYTPTCISDDKTFGCIVKHTILFLQRHTELIDNFQREVSKTKNGQVFYFEQFINIDYLNSFYGDGLRYYLIEKSTSDAQIFGHWLLCLRSWLSEDTQGVRKHYDEVVKYNPAKIYNPIFYARYLATQLLYAGVYDLPIEKIAMEAQQIHASIKNNGPEDKYQFLPFYEYILSTVLFLIGHPTDALYFIDYSHNPSHKHTYTDIGFHKTLNLIKALILARTGRKKEAEELYQQIHPSKFYFLTKKSNAIMYLLLSKYLHKNNKQSDQQLSDLITSTGFTKLNQMLNVEK